MKNIWQKVIKNKTFFCLAPMADVTDIAFRQIIAKYSKHGKKGAAKHGVSGRGGPDLFWTEFVSADGLASKEGRKKLLPILKFSKKEKPIIAQIFGANPENIKTTCQIISKLGFDGIDINMGCPDKGVIKQGAGSALIRTPSLAREIIRSAKEGAPKLPISVKTRLGFNTFEYKTWLSEILKENISALTIHLRTKKEMSKVDAHWELAKDVVKTVRKIDKNVVLIANGDIKSLEEGKEKALSAGFDGVMIGRGIFGKPWLFANFVNESVSSNKIEHPVKFSQTKNNNINNLKVLFKEKDNSSKIVRDEFNSYIPTTKEKLKILVEHTKLFIKLLSKQKRFDVMKKHFKAYVTGFDGAKELRIKLMKTENIKDMEKIINSF
ncbi:MAG: tRNA-dihydrouridine synthase [Candidatus Paceibacterota bacterium]|jgi:tRNA-dihydrouridine synthase